MAAVSTVKNDRGHDGKDERGPKLDPGEAAQQSVKHLAARQHGGKEGTAGRRRDIVAGDR